MSFIKTTIKTYILLRLLILLHNMATVHVDAHVLCIRENYAMSAITKMFRNGHVTIRKSKSSMQNCCY